VCGVVGGSEIGSTLLNNGGALGLDIDPSDARSVLILGGRRGPEVPGKSHNVCLLSISRRADVVCGSSSGGVEKDDSANCGADKGEKLGILKVYAGAGCVVFGGELGGIDGTRGDGFGGKKSGALGFKGILKGEEAASRGGGRGWGGSMTAFGGDSVNEGSGFVAGGDGWAVGVGRKNEGGVCEDVIDPSEWWGCNKCSDRFPERGGIGRDVGCPNTDECWPPPNTDIDEVPPKTELGVKGLGVDARAENALLGGAESRSRLAVIPNCEGVGPTKAEEICGGVGSGAMGSGSSPRSICSTKSCEPSSALASPINSSSSS